MRLMTCFGLLRGLLTSALVLAILLALAYVCLCHRADQLARLENGQSVVLVGWVRAAYEPGSPQGAYELEDATGKVFVTTQLGAPQSGTMVLVWGNKKNTNTGRPVLIERRRIGNF